MQTGFASKVVYQWVFVLTLDMIANAILGDEHST